MKKFLLGILIVGLLAMFVFKMMRIHVYYTKHAFYTGYLAGINRQILIDKRMATETDEDSAWERYKEDGGKSEIERRNEGQTQKPKQQLSF